MMEVCAYLFLHVTIMWCAPISAAGMISWSVMIDGPYRRFHVFDSTVITHSCTIVSLYFLEWCSSSIFPHHLCRYTFSLRDWLATVLLWRWMPLEFTTNFLALFSDIHKCSTHMLLHIPRAFQLLNINVVGVVISHSCEGLRISKYT